MLKKLYPNLPEYFYQTPKQRRKYFMNLNKKYKERLAHESEISRPYHQRKVRILEKKNSVQTFRKQDSIMKVKKNVNKIYK